ncbi:conserved protein of unknown function [Tenacibaculum sp. 190130A14a]
MLVSFLTLSANAQETIWFDANWQETSKDNASYYRPAPQKKGNGFWIIDYFKNGQIQMEGFSTSVEPHKEEFEGLVTYYHQNGKPYHEANYKKGQLHGVRKVYFESGELKEQGKYKDGQRDGIWKTFYKSGKIETKGKYHNGEKVGVWKTFYKNIQ